MSQAKNPIPPRPCQSGRLRRRRSEWRIAWRKHGRCTRTPVVWRIARDAQRGVVNPFLDSHPRMKLSCWKGRYGLYKDGIEQYPGEDDADIFDLLEVRVEGYGDALATWMMDYPAREKADDQEQV